jgi:5-methylcytosine-specific restriction endonuclease McrA
VRISIKKIKQTSGAIKKRLHSHNCLRCKTKTATATHHIVYKSEAPRHKNLHNERNLIDLCYDCHIEWYHAKKDRREHLIKKRKLWELFPKKIQKYNP